MGKSKKKSKGKSTAENGQVKVQSSDDATKESAPQTEESMSRNLFPEENSWDEDASGKEVKDKKNGMTKNDSEKDNRKEENGRQFPNSRQKNSRWDDNRNAGGYKSRQSEPYMGAKKYGEDRGGERKTFSYNENERGRRGGRDNSNNSKRYRSNVHQDDEFLQYEEELSSHKGKIEYNKTKEVVSDLFEVPEEYTLAHCVAVDMNMGSGIAVQFRHKFKRVDELLNQHQSTGGLAILTIKERYIYYLVTKKFSTGKPTYATLFSSLKCLRKHVTEKRVEKIAMPRIGCGLDRLEWENVKFMVEFVFRDVNVEIVVCNLEPVDDSSPQQRHRNCKVTHEKYPIEEIESGTIILYFSSEDEHISEEMRKLDEKFHFLTEFRCAKKTKGNPILYIKNQNYLVCGCIVKKSERDVFDFVALQKCLYSIQKENKKYEFYYYAFQAIRDETDPCINYKIINILRNSLRDVEVYVCWPSDLMNEMAPRDRFVDERSEETWRPKNNSFATNWRDGGKKTFNESDGSGRMQSDSFRSTESKGSTSWANESQWGDSVAGDVSTGNDEDNSVWFQETTSGANENQWDDSAVGPPSRGNDADNGAWFQGEDENSSPEKELKSSSQTSWPSSDSYQQGQSSQYQDMEKSEQNPPHTVNHEYESFQIDLESGSIPHTLKEQKTSDLPKQYSRVCFATEDLIMQSGIAPGDDITPQIGKLLNQKEQTGGLTYAKEGNNFLYYLIIAPPNQPPTSQSVFSAIQKLRDHATRNRVKKLVIPILQTSGDCALPWSEIKSMFEYLLGNRSIDVVAAPFHPVYDVASLLAQNKFKLTHSRSPIHQMKKKSVIIYLASADGKFTEEMNGLAKKFDFKEDFQKKRKVLGDVIKYKENEDHVLYGCVVRKGSVVDFEELRKCVCEVNDRNKQVEKLPIVGIQAGMDQGTNFKILTVLLHCLQDVSITMCWPGDLRSLMPSK